jgi:hypothetical protein
VLVLVLVNLTPVQNFLMQRVVVSLAKKLDTRVAVKHIRIDFANHLLLEGLYIEDKAGDTLLYAGQARVRITDWFFLRSDEPVITYIGLHNAYVHLYRTRQSDEWNYKFIEDAFDTGKKDSTKKQNEFELDLEKADLQNVRFHMDDAWVGSDMDIDVGSLRVNADEIDLKKRVIDINLIELKRGGIVLRDYEGGRPPKPRKPRVLDTTAFNKGNWLVSAKSLVLEDCFFKFDVGDGPARINEFDESHMHITGINIDARKVSIVKDTIRGRMAHLAAKDHSGIMIRKASADVSVSPIASIARNLYLETNNSRLQHFYAMYYERFPDFNDYIHKVVMEADMRNSVVDSRDVAYFAPVLRKYPTLAKISGYAKGTVDNIYARNLQVSDGGFSIKGDVRMKGLPDIYTTWIEYTNGEILTSGQAIMKYAPELRNHPNLALEKVTHAYFAGNFKGYIENFAANGSLVTNLGTLRSDITMKIPDFRQQTAVYAGKVSTDNFNLGTLIRQPDLGVITFSGNVHGNAFDPKDAKISLDAVISRFDYKGYPYRNITANGLLEKNRFNGDLMVDDPNLALAFNGIFDFSKDQLAINAKANLLKSDLTALKLTKDTLTVSADFDLDWQGNTIDNFLGYAKLYNINLLRNGHRLDLDSIHAYSTTDNGKKSITIESNALRAVVKGDFQLSSLPASIQSYIGNYLPNYIHPPKTIPADQNLTFEIRTKEIDSLLAVVSPNLSGFRDATILGALNTAKQQLSVDAMIPYGRIGEIRIQNATITSLGDFRQLAVNADADNVMFGDLHGAISLTTTVGNDSLTFNIASSSTSEYGTATINGRAYARGDTMNIFLAPSEFYLAKTRWEIPGGSQAAVSNDYLFIRNLRLSSDKQEITVNSEAGTGQPLVIQTSNLDLAHLGSIAGLSVYEPTGRMNGTITLSNVFNDLLVSANLKATEVKLGEDTIGNVNAIGSYDAGKHLLILDPSSGVYRGNASITAGGRTVFDSTSNRKLDGNIVINNAPIEWIAPFVQGYVSKLGGTLNGSVAVKGTASEPDVEGTARMDNAHVRIDFLGTEYDIHTATIKINNNEINFGDFTLFDAYKNRAIFNGKITHNRFKNLRLAMNMGSSKFQVLNLKDYENEAFYGNLIAGFQNLSITGPIDDIRIRIQRAMPADKSQLYIPIGTTSEQASYSYVTFKSYDTTKQAIVVKKPKNKLNIEIDARLNTLAEITLVLDPSTGDAITATGTGNINMSIPSDNDIKMYGQYDIEKGNYLFTLRQLFFKRKFDLNPGSRINFNGLIAQTSMNVEGVYTVRAKPYDMLNRDQQTIVNANNNEAKEAKTTQDVDVLLYMKGSLENPTLSFKLGIPEQRPGTIAYEELRRVNQVETALFNHVATLLLIGSFYPQDNALGGGATAGAISNVSEVLSGTASSQLTNLVNRLTGNDNLSLAVKYGSYATTDATGTTDPTTTRSTVSFGFDYKLFDDRVSVEYGGSYDWGKQTNNTNNSRVLNLAGDVRVSYQLREGGNTRGYFFRKEGFDALGNQSLKRVGLGLSWRKSFNTLEEFVRGEKYAARKLEEQMRRDSSTNNNNNSRPTGGTW